MSERTLRDCRILVVEDEYVLAEELRNELEVAGAIVLGPVATLDDALQMARSEREIDGATLDVNLGGEKVFPVADILLARNVPFVFATGYDVAALPGGYRHIVRCDKPADLQRVAQAIGRVIHS